MEFTISIADVIGIVSYMLLLAGLYFTLKQKIALLEKDNQQHQQKMTEVSRNQELNEKKIEGKIRELKKDLSGEISKLGDNIGEMQKDIRNLLIKIGQT